MAKYLVLIMLLLWVVLAFQSTVVVVGDYASDQAKCSKSLVGLATCLPYVQGAAKMPTPDCCTGLKEVLSKTRKCLCVLIKDRNDPNLGIKINVSLAIMLPDACKAPANFTKCPELLKLPPNSPDAQIFKQPDKALQGNSTTAKGNSASAPESSKVGSNHLGRREWLKVEMVSGLLFLLVMPFLGY